MHCLGNLQGSTGIPKARITQIKMGMTLVQAARDPKNSRCNFVNTTHVDASIPAGRQGWSSPGRGPWRISPTEYVVLCCVS